LSLTCFEDLSVHHQEDLYMQFYGMFSCIRISSLVDGRMCVSSTSCHRPDCLYGCIIKHFLLSTRLLMH